jgi:hypothetical protein
MSIHDDEISFRFVGRHDEDDHILFEDFIKQLNYFLQALNKTFRHITPSEVPALNYQVIDLRHSSPAVISLKAEAHSAGAESTLDLFCKAIKEIQGEGRVREDFDREILEAYKNVGIQLLRDRFTNVAIIYRGDELMISRSLVHNIDAVLDQEVLEEDGSVSGRLEEINVHAGANLFRIYPLIGPSKIICHFPKALMLTAIDAITRHVNVYGKLKYKPREKYAHEINVQDIEIYPYDDELPSILDLRGMAPNATGDLSSEEFVRELRSAWR